MPEYTYACAACGATRCITHRMTERPTVTCDTCHEQMLRKLQPVAIRFTGTGFYETDYRKKK